MTVSTLTTAIIASTNFTIDDHHIDTTWTNVIITMTGITFISLIHAIAMTVITWTNVTIVTLTDTARYIYKNDAVRYLRWF